MPDLSANRLSVLQDREIMQKIKAALDQTEVAEEIRNLKQTLQVISDNIKAKDDRIDMLETRALELEMQLDNVEQYGRRANLSISGIADPEGEEDTVEKLSKSPTKP